MKMNRIAQLCVFEATNVRPITWNIHNNCSGDCTTRALTYALNGEMTYNEIEAEQYRIAKLHNCPRNRTGIYDAILKARGWCWLQFDKCMTRGEVAYWLKEETFDIPILTLSRSHIACVQNGKLIDTWDSRGGRVFAILVKACVAPQIIIKLEKHGIDAKQLMKTQNPKHIGNKRRTMTWDW